MIKGGPGKGSAPYCTIQPLLEEQLKKLAFLIISILAVSISSIAQQSPSTSLTAYVGYQYTHTDGGYAMNGFVASAGIPVSDAWSVKLDVRSGYKENLGSLYQLYTFTAGPMYSFRRAKQVSPFAEALIGGGVFSGLPDRYGAFAAQLGGGLDINRAHWGLRVVEVDYLLTTFQGSGHNNVQISTGLLWHF